MIEDQKEQLLTIIKQKSCIRIDCMDCVILNECCGISDCPNDMACMDCEQGPFVMAVQKFIEIYGRDQLVKELL